MPDGPSGGTQLAATQGWPQGLMLASESESRGRLLYCVCVVGEALEYGSSKIWQGSRAPESRLPHSTISSGRNRKCPSPSSVPIMLMRHKMADKMGGMCDADSCQSGRPPCIIIMTVERVHGNSINSWASNFQSCNIMSTTWPL